MSAARLSLILSFVCGALATALLFTASPERLFAQSPGDKPPVIGYGMVVSACGAQTYVAGTYQPLTLTTTGNRC